MYIEMHHSGTNVFPLLHIFASSRIMYVGLHCYGAKWNVACRWLISVAEQVNI